MVRCSQCVLSDATPQIVFDSAGVCNYCKSYEEFQYSGEPALLEILEAHRDKTAKYDCLVTISGGRDSTYTLWKLAVDYGMRVLAVNYQNPFTTPEGKANIANAVSSLGVDLVQFGFPRRLHQRSLGHYLSAWLTKPSAAMVPMVCAACKLMWVVIPGIARKHGISLIVSGGNPLEYTSFKKVSLGASGDLSTEANIKDSYDKVIFGLLREVLGNPAYLHPRYLTLTARGYLFATPYSIGSRIIGRGMERLDLFHFIKWDEDQIISTISSQMGWNRRTDGPSTWRTDCMVSCLKDAMYVKTMGMTEKDDFYSKMVRQGLVTREEGLERVANEGVLEWELIEEVLHEVGMEDALGPLGGP
ncbi:MAG TPA: ATPase [Anaerolineae bacterium]|nr:ATPase [Anaerolineae bacterium]